MDRAAFEQLVSEWLDDPGRLELRAQLEAAIATDPELARVRNEYVELDALLRRTPDALCNVDWGGLRAQAIAAAEGVAGSEMDAELFDAHLRAALPGIDERVDWRRLRARLSNAVDSATAGPPVPRVIRWRAAGTAVALAAAAVLMLMVRYPTEVLTPDEPAPPAARVVVKVLPPAGVDEDADPGGAIVHLTVHEEPQPGGTSAARDDQTTSPTEPELYFLLEPPVVASAGSFGGP